MGAITRTSSSSIRPAPTSGLAPALLGGNTAIEDVRQDTSGNAYLAGSLSGVADFAGTLIAAKGAADAFVVKLSPAGAHLSSQKYGDANASGARDIGVDRVGSVLLTGDYSSTIDLGSGVMTSPMGVKSAFLARLP